MKKELVKKKEMVKKDGEAAENEALECAALQTETASYVNLKILRSRRSPIFMVLVDELIPNAAYNGTPGKGKGILAADESTGTIGKRFSRINEMAKENEAYTDDDLLAVLHCKAFPYTSSLLDELIANAAYNGTPGKGILAADESTGTIGKRLSRINKMAAEKEAYTDDDLLALFHCEAFPFTNRIFFGRAREGSNTGSYTEEKSQSALRLRMSYDSTCVELRKRFLATCPPRNLAIDENDPKRSRSDFARLVLTEKIDCSKCFSHK
ncbi:hypothetical protein OROHE_010489 [Orobanche hederae]